MLPIGLTRLLQTSPKTEYKAAAVEVGECLLGLAGAQGGIWDKSNQVRTRNRES